MCVLIVLNLTCLCQSSKNFFFSLFSKGWKKFSTLDRVRIAECKRWKERNKGTSLSRNFLSTVCYIESKLPLLPPTFFGRGILLGELALEALKLEPRGFLNLLFTVIAHSNKKIKRAHCKNAKKAFLEKLFLTHCPYSNVAKNSTFLYGLFQIPSHRRSLISPVAIFHYIRAIFA